jgi:hypothetical protein
MLKTKASKRKTLTQVRAATLADVKRMLAKPRTVASAVKRFVNSKSKVMSQLDSSPTFLRR